MVTLLIGYNLAEDANLTAVKCQLIGHLTGSEYYVAPTPPVISGSSHFDDDKGDTLG